MADASKSPKPLKPGVYHGRRSAVPIKNSPWNHGYVAVIPKDEKKLSPKARKSVKSIGPNGERGFIVSSDVKRKWKDYVPGPKFGTGKMVSGVNINQGDIKDFRRGAPSGRRNLSKTKSGKAQNPTKLANGLHKSGEKFPDVRYPKIVPNFKGEGKNSNSFVKTALKQNGVKMRAEKSLQGSKLTFAELLDRPITELEAKRSKPKQKRQPRTRLQNVRDGALTAAGVAGVVGAGIVTRKGLQGVKKLTKTADGTLSTNKKTMIDANRVASNAKAGSEVYGDLGRVYIKGKGWVKEAGKELKTGGNLKAGMREGRKPGEKEHLGHKAGRAVGKITKAIGLDEALDLPITEFEVTVDGLRKAHSDSKRVYRQAKTAGRNLRRAKSLAKDTGDAIKGKPREKDRAGRQKLREYEKEWFKGAVATGSGMLAIGAGLGAKALAKGKGGPVAGAINDPVGTTTRAISSLKKKPKPASSSSSKNMVEMGEPVSGLDVALLDLPIDAIAEFAEAKKQGGGTTWIRDADGNKVLRVTDARGHGARVYGPKSKRRHRRNKRPEEKIENERKRHAKQKGLIAGAGATTAAVTGVGVHLASRGRIKGSYRKGKLDGIQRQRDHQGKMWKPRHGKIVAMVRERGIHKHA